MSGAETSGRWALLLGNSQTVEMMEQGAGCSNAGCSIGNGMQTEHV
jgi:hypothetical protein